MLASIFVTLRDPLFHASSIFPATLHDSALTSDEFFKHRPQTLSPLQAFTSTLPTCLKDNERPIVLSLEFTYKSKSRGRPG